MQRYDFFQKVGKEIEGFNSVSGYGFKKIMQIDT